MIWNVLDYYSFYLLNTNKIRAAKSSFSVAGKELRFFYMGLLLQPWLKLTHLDLENQPVFFLFLLDVRVLSEISFFRELQL